MIKDKKYILFILVAIILFVVCFIVFKVDKFYDKKDIKEDNNIKKLEVLVTKIDEDYITLINNKDIFYNIDKSLINCVVGDNLVIEYTGVFGSDNFKITNYTISEGINFNDSGVFSEYYDLAYNKLKELSLDEKIGQLILARYPDNSILEDLNTYKLSGYVFFGSDFKNKTKEEVQEMIRNLQSNSSIPLIISVDEEGGKVVRVSSNSNLVAEEFKSSQELYKEGGMNAIYSDTINKSKVLYELGINVNLAPVVDVSTNSSDYIYERTIGENSLVTSLYAKTVIDASKGLGVSYTLKHFPGYGNNIDTHLYTSIDNRSYESILAIDIPPFLAGIEAGAEAVMISHNIVSSIDNINPASLSMNIHNLLRDNLGFTGVIITDDLSMGAISSIPNADILAVLAGNNLIITTDYVSSINSIKTAVNDGVISEGLIDKLVFKVIAWKYYKKLL